MNRSDLPVFQVSEADIADTGAGEVPVGVGTCEPGVLVELAGGEAGVEELVDSIVEPGIGAARGAAGVKELVESVVEPGIATARGAAGELAGGTRDASSDSFISCFSGVNGMMPLQ